MMHDLIKLRHTLHKYPEISNNEFQTSERISAFIAQFNADEIIKLSKTGLAFVFNGKSPGKTLIFRAELDALQIREENNLPYSSVNEGVAHLCGHDGHMAILAGFGQLVSANRPQKGRVILLFQPAEEIEQGARDVVEDPAFKSIQPDYIFALHNIPGFEKNTIIIKEGTFASASKGLTIKLKGKTSHAGEPESGINPANAISRIIQDVNMLSNDKSLFNDLVLSTFINIKLGEVAFGTSPGYGEVRLTLRSYENSDMKLLGDSIIEIVSKICSEESLGYEYEYSEDFPATVNDRECFGIIKKAASENGLRTVTIDKPFRWSEDFAYYTNKYRGGFFGLGSGLSQPKLHNPDYDFPDEIIQTGIKMFYQIYIEILEQQKTDN